MTREEFIDQLKAECEHNIGVLEKAIDKLLKSYPDERFSLGAYEGQLRFDKDILERINDTKFDEPEKVSAKNLCDADEAFNEFCHGRQCETCKYKDTLNGMCDYAYKADFINNGGEK